jgi:hypothetical protein
MTIKDARKKLGKLAESLSDTELSKEIDTARYLAQLVMKEYLQVKNSRSLGK